MLNFMSKFQFTYNSQLSRKIVKLCRQLITPRNIYHLDSPRKQMYRESQNNLVSMKVLTKIKYKSAFISFYVTGRIVRGVTIK